MTKGVKYYLAAYNLIAGVLWAFFLFRFITDGCKITGTSFYILNIAQGMALLEILHALLKWVKSPLGSTIAQVLSRLMVLILIDYYTGTTDLPYTEQARTFIYAGIVMAVMAWSVTEIIRYGLYFLTLFDSQPQWLVWMRYSFFIVLYPLGVTGEGLIIIFTLLPRGLSLNINTAMVAVIFVAYAIFFPRLYMYMWKQRKLKLP